MTPDPTAADLVAAAKPQIERYYRETLEAQKAAAERTRSAAKLGELSGEIRGIQMMRRIFDNALASARAEAAKRGG